MYPKNQYIHACGPAPAVCQIHKSLKCCTGRDQITDIGKKLVVPHRQILQGGNCHKYNHDYFDIYHTHQQAS